jgi:putative ABC transport system permease protein
LFKNDLKVSFRNISRHKGHSFINIAGLAVGMAACLILFLWVQDELNFDCYHDKADRIYRVVSQYEVEGVVKRSATTQAPLLPALMNEFPEVKKGVRLGNNGFLVRYRDKLYHENIFFADPEIFNVFSFPLVRGNPRNALKETHSILISEEMRVKYFGDDNPVGKTLTIDENRDYKITGVFKNIPRNSHFRFNFLSSFLDYAGRHSDKWGISNYYTYILISKNYPVHKLDEKMPGFVEKYGGKESRYKYKSLYTFQPLTRIHLHSDLANEIEPNSDIKNIYIISVIALFILLIACSNYINLSTAMHFKRTKEVGLRKVFGATRAQLMKQFLSDSFLFSFISVLLAIGLVGLFLPVFNSLSGKQLEINYFNNLFLLPGLIGISLCVGFISGIFPASFISALQPVKAFKGILHYSSTATFLRQGLVVFQFSISIIFIISTIIISNQLSFIKNKKLGFDKEYILNIPIHSSEALQKYETIKYEFIQNANVSGICASSFIPGNDFYYQNYWHKGINPDAYPMITWIPVDHDFIKTFQIKLVEGRDFSKKFHDDVKGAYLINEAAAKEFGWQSTIGNELTIGNAKGKIIGIVEDFHYKSLHKKIKPLALFISPELFKYFSVRINAENIPQTLRYLKTKWQELVPSQSFEYSFLDEDIDNLYKVEIRLRKIFVIISILAILIACLGLFGLTSFIEGLRTKEIAIRKVFGGSIPGIVILLIKDFIKCVLVSNIIAWPISWYAMNQWLQNFAHRVDIYLWIFLLAGILSIAFTTLTVSFKAIKAALVNPVEVLKYE